MDSGFILMQMLWQVAGRGKSMQSPLMFEPASHCSAASEGLNVEVGVLRAGVSVSDDSSLWARSCSPLSLEWAAGGDQAGPASVGFLAAHITSY